MINADDSSFWDIFSPDSPRGVIGQKDTREVSYYFHCLSRSDSCNWADRVFSSANIAIVSAFVLFISFCYLVHEF